LCIFSFFETNKARTFVRVLGLALELCNLHIARSFTEYRVGYLPKLFHMFLKSLLTHVPSDVAHEKRRVVRVVRSLLRFFKLFLGHNYWLFNNFFLFLFCLFLFFKFDRLRTNNFLLSLVGILKNVLHLRFVGGLGQTELNGEVTSFELFAVHGVDCALSIGFIREFNEAKSSVLVVGVVQWHVDAFNFTKLLKSFFQVFFSHVENEVAHDDAALFRRRRTVSLLSLVLFGFCCCWLRGDL
jgi:hypothetical protein